MKNQYEQSVLISWLGLVMYIKKQCNIHKLKTVSTTMQKVIEGRWVLSMYQFLLKCIKFK